MSFSLRRFYFIGKFLKKVFSYFPKKEFIIKNSIGIWSVLPFNDTMTISAEYFEEELKHWLDEPKQKRIFIDIGANIGRYTILAAKHFDYSKILSIEANPFTHEILKKNVILNKINDKVITKQVAVGDKEAEVVIQSDSHHLGGGNIVDYNIHSQNMDNKIGVHLTTVNQICFEEKIDVTEVDFIKIDVEGMEKEVLEGMALILSKMPSKSCIMIEITQNEEKVVEIFTKYKFIKIDSEQNDNLFMKQ